jgi:hypothetical protein
VWRNQLDCVLTLLDLDYVLSSPCPEVLADVVRGTSESEESFQTRQSDHTDKIAKRDLDRANWQKNNKKCLKIMQTKMSEVIRASIPKKKSDGVDHTAAEFLAVVEKQHDTHSKTYASTLINKLTSLHYTGGDVKDHILSMSNMNGKLTSMDMGLPEQFLVHLPPEFSTFEVNYNSLTEKWDLHKLVNMCVQEEERLKQQNGGSVNFLQNTNKKRTFGSKGCKAKNQNESGPSHAPSKSQGKAPAQQFQHQRDKKPTVAPNQCLWCKETGHWQKDCPKWMKHILKKGEDIITFVDETLYLSYFKSTWWIDSSATVHVANSM